jgi:hypothetical protein
LFDVPEVEMPNESARGIGTGIPNGDLELPDQPLIGESH